MITIRNCLAIVVFFGLQHNALAIDLKMGLNEISDSSRTVKVQIKVDIADGCAGSKRTNTTGSVRRISKIDIHAKGNALLIPGEACFVCDLLEPYSAAIRSTKGVWILEIDGGDTEGAYRIEFIFSAKNVLFRRVYVAGVLYEETKYLNPVI